MILFSVLSVPQWLKSPRENPDIPSNTVRGFQPSGCRKSQHHFAWQLDQFTVAVCERHGARGLYGGVNHTDERISADGDGLAAKAISEDKV